MSNKPAPLPPPPRKVRRSKKYITSLKTFTVLALLTFPWWCVPEGGKYIDVSRLLHSGVMTKATMTDSVEEDRYHAGKGYVMTLKFTDTRGRTVSSDADVTYDQYTKTSLGDKVPLTYLPGNSDVCRVGKVTSEQVNAVVREFLIGFGALAGFYLVIAVGIFFDDRRQRLLLEAGEVVQAKIVRLSRGGRVIYEVTYTFDSGGRTYRGVDRIDQKVLKPPPEGETLDVLVGPSRPSYSKPVASLSSFEVAD